MEYCLQIVLSISLTLSLWNESIRKHSFKTNDQVKPKIDVIYYL